MVSQSWAPFVPSSPSNRATVPKGVIELMLLNPIPLFKLVSCWVPDELPSVIQSCKPLGPKAEKSAPLPKAVISSGVRPFPDVSTAVTGIVPEAVPSVLHNWSAFTPTLAQNRAKPLITVISETEIPPSAGLTLVTACVPEALPSVNHSCSLWVASYPTNRAPLAYGVRSLISNPPAPGSTLVRAEVPEPVGSLFHNCAPSSESAAPNSANTSRTPLIVSGLLAAIGPVVGAVALELGVALLLITSSARQLIWYADCRMFINNLLMAAELCCLATLTKWAPP